MKRIVLTSVLALFLVAFTFAAPHLAVAYNVGDWPERDGLGEPRISETQRLVHSCSGILGFFRCLVNPHPHQYERMMLPSEGAPNEGEKKGDKKVKTKPAKKK